MGDTPSLFHPSFNGLWRVKTRSERLSGAAGFLLLGDALVDTGVIGNLNGQLYNSGRQGSWRARYEATAHSRG